MTFPDRREIKNDGLQAVTGKKNDGLQAVIFIYSVPTAVACPSNQAAS